MDKGEASETAEKSLWSVEAATYGAAYQQHLIEQYRLFVEMADRVSARRGTTNSFLLSVNALLVTGFGILASTTDNGDQAWRLALPIAGLVVSVAWFVLLQSYKRLNAAKFAVIHLLEDRLPAATYLAEWELLGRGKTKVHLALTIVESAIPLVFTALYVALISAATFDLF